MAFLYAISDPHGCLDVLEQALTAVDLTGNNHLYLLGDYIPHETVQLEGEAYLRRCAESLSFVRALEVGHPRHVTALAGNHEYMLLERDEAGEISISARLRTWLRSLPYYAETERQIFVHAGVDEEAGEYWKWGSDDWYFCSKFPPTLGRFRKDVVAGHVSAASLVRGEGAHDHVGAFWDGESHYYIDGTTERTGVIPVLAYDTERGRYTQRIATAQGVEAAIPFEA